MSERVQLVKSISASDLAKLGKWYSTARTALEKAYRIDEVLKIKNKAEAVRLYALQERDTALQNQATEISLRAQKRGGAMLAELEKSQGGRPETVSHAGKSLSQYKDVLDDAGLSYKKAAHWQQIAAIPDEKFEQAIIKIKEKIGGELTKAAVIREVVQAPIRAAKEQELTSIEAMRAKEIAGTFDVIVIDPPWPMDKIDRDTRPGQVSFDYPVMSIEQIRAEVGKMLDEHAEPDAHIFLWTTQKFLPFAFGLIDNWNLAYGEAFTWHKNGGFQPFGGPQYNSEFVVRARKGSPIFLETTNFMTCFTGDRGRHSEKPSSFYEMIRRVTGGRRLDLYARGPHEGFISWGKEASAGN